MIQSSTIQDIVHCEAAERNEIVEISEGWTKVKQVVHMRNPLSQSVRKTALANQALRYWSTDSTPHDKATEGFTDDTNKVSIAFPR